VVIQNTPWASIGYRQPKAFVEGKIKAAAVQNKAVNSCSQPQEWGRCSQ